MSRIRHLSWHQRFENSKCINTMILHFLVPKVGEYNMGKIKKVEKMGKVKEMKRKEWVRRIEKTIEEIR